MSINPWEKQRGKYVLDTDGHKTLKSLPDGISYTWRRDKKKKWIVDTDGDRVAADRYRARADTLTTPPGVTRNQMTSTHATLDDAKDWLAEVRTGDIDWTPPPEPEVAPETVDERLDKWLKNRARKVRPVTMTGYRTSAKPWRDAFGTVALVDLTEEQVGDKVDAMTGAGKSPATIRLAMIVLRGALREAVATRVIDRDPSDLVTLPARKRANKRAWTSFETKRFLASVADDRDEPLFRLSLIGLRRSELLGLTWDDVEGDKIRVQRGRVAVNCKTVEVGEPKRESSRRELPIAGTPIVAALHRLRVARIAEAAVLSVEVKGSDYLAVNAALEPYRPEAYSDLWTDAVKACDGLPVLTLHEARHTAATLLAAKHMAPEVAAEWLGHDVKVYLSTYVHADEERVAGAGRLLGEAFG